jgi:hypothetical protein
MLSSRSQRRLCRSSRRSVLFPRSRVLLFTSPVMIANLSFADNHMINGTKLLNVAGMTRGRRDGILKSEKTRHVVKIGPMHLKGVW